MLGDRGPVARSRGKRPMVVIAAAMRKLLVLAYGVVKSGLVYCGDAGNDDGEVFMYPAGGSPVATFTGNFDTPLGVVAAEK